MTRLNPFVYDGFVTGAGFVGRRTELKTLTGVLSGMGNAVVLGAPKSGKMSLVQQSFAQMRAGGKRFETCLVDMLGIRNAEEFLTAMGDSVIRCFASAPFEFKQALFQYFAGTHFYFDEKAFISRGRIFSISGEADEADMAAMMEFPFSIAVDRNTNFYVVLDEFQNIEFFDGEVLLKKVIDRTLKKASKSCAFVFLGSRLNAMKEIFRHFGYLHGCSTIVEVGEIGEDELCRHIYRTLVTNGKVIEDDMMTKVCHLFHNNIWYIEQFMSICDHLSKGFVTEPVFNESVSMMLGSNEGRFRDVMADLTNFQVSLLRAIIDGHTHFSSSEVIAKYNLNSSANVKRVRDALLKKEVISLDNQDNTYIIDPLFEYWVRKFFFHACEEN